MDYGRHDLVQELSEEVKCHICLELFNDPRILNCSHTFCFSCLEQLANGKSKIDCPLCRQPHKLDRQGVQSLPKNRYVANVVEKLKKPATSIPYPYSLYASTVSTVPFQSTSSSDNLYPPSSNPDYQPIVADAPLLYSALSSPTYNTEPTFSINTTPVADCAPSAPPLEDLLETPQTPVVTATAPMDPPPLPTRPSTVPMAPTATAVPPPKEEESLLSSMFTSIKSLFTLDDTPQTSQQSQTIQPYYAPWKIPPSQLQSCFNTWAKSLWFAPSEFLDQIKFSQIQAIYTPYWIFSGNSVTSYSGQVSHYEKSTSSKKRIEVWDRASGTRNSRHKDVVFNGDITVTSSAHALILEISDFDFFKANLREPPTQSVATRVRIDRYMEMSKAWGQVSQRLIHQEGEVCKQQLKFDQKAEKMTDFNFKVDFNNVTGQLVFMPCYLATYKYEDSEYLFVVSGQTGTTKGQRPYGLGKLGSLGKTVLSPLGGMLFGGKKT